MNVPFFKEIDWQRPWLAPLLAIASPVRKAVDWRQALNAAAAMQALQNHRGMPIRFVAQADLPPATAYESFISATGGVPTRDNVHDFFNALIWLAFPAIKAQLNALHAAEIAKTAAIEQSPMLHRSHRGKLRDAATIFDENAALLVSCNRELIDALHEHRWHEALVIRRAAFWRDCEVWLFGHALLEKLVCPYKAITAHTWVVNTDSAFFSMPLEHRREWIDAQVAGQLTHGLATADFTPLPVLGVPGWGENQDELFYQDAQVFRPKRNIDR
jgi:hypothetical protein